MVKGLWQHFRGLYRHGLGVALRIRDDIYVLDAPGNDYTAKATKLHGRYRRHNCRSSGLIEEAPLHIDSVIVARIP